MGPKDTDPEDNPGHHCDTLWSRGGHRPWSGAQNNETMILGHVPLRFPPLTMCHPVAHLEAIIHMKAIKKVSDKKQAQSNILLLLRSFLARRPWASAAPIVQGSGCLSQLWVLRHVTSPLQAPGSSSLSERVGWVFSLKTNDFDFGSPRFSASGLRSSVIFGPGQCLAPRSLLHFLESCLSSKSCLDTRTQGFWN